MVLALVARVEVLDGQEEPRVVEVDTDLVAAVVPVAQAADIAPVVALEPAERVVVIVVGLEAQVVQVARAVDIVQAAALALEQVAQVAAIALAQVAQGLELVGAIVPAVVQAAQAVDTAQAQVVQVLVNAQAQARARVLGIQVIGQVVQAQAQALVQVSARVRLVALAKGKHRARAPAVPTETIAQVAHAGVAEAEGVAGEDPAAVAVVAAGRTMTSKDVAAMETWLSKRRASRSRAQSLRFWQALSFM
jgi:hypothetical protein